MFIVIMFFKVILEFFNNNSEFDDLSFGDSLV